MREDLELETLEERRLSLRLILMYKVVAFLYYFYVMQSSKCFALMFLFGLANLTKLSVGSAGTNPSTTLYIRIRIKMSNFFYRSYQVLLTDVVIIPR
jgi:hypothetical protein